jgi:hypothetical protein
MEEDDALVNEDRKVALGPLQRTLRSSRIGEANDSIAFNCRNFAGIGRAGVMVESVERQRSGRRGGVMSGPKDIEDGADRRKSRKKLDSLSGETQFRNTWAVIVYESQLKLSFRFVVEYKDR